MKANFEKGTKVCSRCRKELSISCFRKDNSNKDGLGAYCKKCNSDKDKQYYRRNIKQLRMKMRDRNNKERNAKKRKERLDCFGCHIDGDGKCNLCVYERECMNETKERERCFGKSYGKRPIVVCGTCKYAKRCEALKKHE